MNLTDGEKKVYEILIKNKSMLRNQISLKTKISISNIEPILNKLIEKKLVYKFKKDNKVYFNNSNKEFLIEFIENRKQEINDESKLFLKIIDDFKICNEEEYNFEIYTGWGGIEKCLEESLYFTVENSKIYGIGIRFSNLGFIRNFRKQLKEKNINLKVIETEKPSVDKGDFKVKYLYTKQKVGIAVFPNSVVIYHGGEDSQFCIKIVSKNVSNMFKIIHDMLWDLAPTE